jgi:hypothetical protein
VIERPCAQEVSDSTMKADETSAELKMPVTFEDEGEWHPDTLIDFSGHIMDK